ncbi:MAG: hypothetical protein E5W27_02895 [Mesorhizobium sp.]|nr:MAG: hypothetical protein E5W27_02895 [Mesorhizobium sp.]
MELAPRNIEALAGFATIDTMSGFVFMSDDRSERFSAAEQAPNQVLSVTPNHAWTHYLLGFVQIHTRRVDQGVAECEGALLLDRNLALAHGAIGQAKYLLGRGAETEAHIKEALRHSPREANPNLWSMSAGFAKLQLGENEASVSRFRQAIEINRSMPLSHFGLAAALACLGQIVDAQAAARNGISLDPTFRVRRFRMGATRDNPICLSGRERIYDAMEKRWRNVVIQETVCFRASSGTASMSGIGRVADGQHGAVYGRLSVGKGLF